MEQEVQRKLAQLRENYRTHRDYLEEQQKGLVDEQRMFQIRLAQLQEECQRAKRTRVINSRSIMIDSLFEQAYKQGEQVVRRAQKKLDNKVTESQVVYQRQCFLLKEGGEPR